MNDQPTDLHYVPELTPAFWEETGLVETLYDTFVETGSYRGATIEHLKRRFSTIHSIELSRRWYEFCRDKFMAFPHIHLHHGDSARILPEVMRALSKPVIVFLDAHYCGGSTARSTAGCDDGPLLDELRYLARREYDDIVIIDDTSFFGQVGGEEPAEAPHEDVAWPAFHYDWSTTTRGRVLSLMKPHYAMLENLDSKYTISPREDQYIWFPARSGRAW